MDDVEVAEDVKVMVNSLSIGCLVAKHGLQPVTELGHVE
jgi:hypothetical protein